MIRAQLSTHEQALLTLNSLSILGKSWEVHDLIAEYNLIKNIPKGFFDDDSIKVMFPNVKFEYEDNNDE